MTNKNQNKIILERFEGEMDLLCFKKGDKNSTIKMGNPNKRVMKATYKIDPFNIVQLPMRIKAASYNRPRLKI